MTDYILPQKLSSGDEVRIIAPSYSKTILTDETVRLASSCLQSLGLKLSFGTGVREVSFLETASIETRLNDLHQAFSDKFVKGILCLHGGYLANQLLDKIDWDIIKDNPKILCGYSDITVINLALLSQANLLNYHGPMFSTLGQKKLSDYTLNFFKKSLFGERVEFELEASESWSDDEWWLNQDNRMLRSNEGWWIINNGYAEGYAIGGNLSSMQLLQGTKYFPKQKNIVLFIEAVDTCNPGMFDRGLQSILHSSIAKNIRAVLVGRFQIRSKIDRVILEHIFRSRTQLQNLPIIANMDFGHTDPKFTFPMGGLVKIEAMNDFAHVSVRDAP